MATDGPANPTGQIVKRLRRGRGWTAQQLADECARAGMPSLTRGTIAKIESGIRKSIASEELVALAQALGVALTELVSLGGGRPLASRMGRPGSGAGQGVVVVSVGGKSIRESVEASLSELSLGDAEFVGQFVHEGYVGPDDFQKLAATIRDQVRRWPEARVSRLNLFYKGPVALGPLLGALLGTMSLAVYHLENGQRSQAYIIDRKFLLSTS
ncbi:helix-turn-helix domain-containing protein [Micromonospora sp. NPDC020750]|uniref:helix-turn-helix domain-containing protein n=1 Tax=unclassified Micromonospora TaxID=2617518 RepID=UPI0037ACE3D7